jgi:hypothetical protein
LERGLVLPPAPGEELWYMLGRVWERVGGWTKAPWETAWWRSGDAGADEEGEGGELAVGDTNWAGVMHPLALLFCLEWVIQSAAETAAGELRVELMVPGSIAENSV